MPSHGDHTSYETYTNLGQHASGHGVINIQTTNYQNSPSNGPLGTQETLFSQCCFRLFRSLRCAESTRLGIIQIIEEWINSDQDGDVPSSLFWLHGGAGVGKSALAQSLSEKYQEKKQLAATFFFFRSDPTRNNGEDLIPTLVSQLVCTFKEIVPFVEDRISENPAIFTKRSQIQIQELLVEPLLALESKGALVSHPRLIVIDGLDECKQADVQSELLRVIARSIPRIPYALRFLVTSRPESHITQVFRHDRDLQAIKVYRYNLSDDPNRDMDIRRHLENEFQEIRRVHRLARHLPHIWPSQEAITSLVERSSGHFIYASTVIRYIGSPKHRPDDRLEVILRLRPPQEGDRPYAQLDALYALIFACVDDHGQLEKICLVLGILYFASINLGFFEKFRACTTTIEELLEMKVGDLVLLLDPILSLIAIDSDGDQIRMLHKSLFDYFLDSSRSEDLPFDLGRVHELGATRILKENILKDMCSLRMFQTFSYHSRHGYPNDLLKNYLHALEVPCPKSIATIPKTFPTWGTELNTLLRTAIWDCFQLLSRKDFDTTGQIYKQYVTKWMRYLRSAAPNQKRLQLPSKAVVDKLDDMKRKLDKLLVKWKPQDFNPKNVEMAPGRPVTIIEQEHGVFSAYAKASFYGNKNAIASSLVFGDYFIHSYNFGIQGQDTFLMLQTYSKHGNRCYQEVFVGYSNIDDLAVSYLKKAEKYLLSDLYQRYGVEPE